MYGCLKLVVWVNPVLGQGERSKDNVSLLKFRSQVFMSMLISERIPFCLFFLVSPMQG